MKSIRTALFISALNVLSINSAHCSGLVLQLNVDTGKFEPASKTDLVDKFPATSPKKTNLKERSFAAASSVEPTKEILVSIENTAKSFFEDRALAKANVSSVEWLALFRANIEIESAYNPQAVSKSGAVGLGQLMPETAKLLNVDINNPKENLKGSAEYLLWLLDSFGSPDLAIAAYNAGPEAVARYKGVPPFDETREHVRKVLGAFFRLRKYYTKQDGVIEIASQG
ncbi:lytic transglycosylase domain-containing protein [Brucella intermedia]|uniref:lytic transglycosylase domain-containing protein n=1 Tax=Brucella intermedia TaxID=94625 RepID=UPI00235FFE23|nr:lytic transglycosylase domain-containing protein [Brucella intermedia]